MTEDRVVAMSMSPSEMTAFTVAAATLFGAFFSGVAMIITAIRSTRAKLDETALKVQENTELTHSVKSAVKIVEGQTNSAATAMNMEIKSLQSELKNLREQLADQKQLAALLAQATQIHAGAPSSVVETQR